MKGRPKDSLNEEKPEGKHEVETEVVERGLAKEGVIKEAETPVLGWKHTLERE